MVWHWCPGDSPLEVMVEAVLTQNAARPNVGKAIRGLRETLLSVSGIGPETADSIILYAAGRQVFVVDAYTRRVLLRHGWTQPKASYEDIQALFMEGLPRDPSLYNEYHALFVALGKVHCRLSRFRTQDLSPKLRCY